MLNSFGEMLGENMIVYTGLGEAGFYGTSINTVIGYLKNEPTPAICVECETKMMPLIFGEDEKLHPLFPEDCSITKPFCYGYEYSPTRVTKDLFDTCVLDILIIDQVIEAGICHLYYRQEELCPDGWEFVEDLALARYNLHPFLRLLHRIQYASLTELLA